jgi:ABC-type multidrug transport system fused ATPase/permease subunit
VRFVVCLIEFLLITLKKKESYTEMMKGCVIFILPFKIQKTTQQTNKQQGVGASSRVLELIERPPDVPPRPLVVSKERFNGKIEFDKVEFAYAGEKECGVCCLWRKKSAKNAIES